MESNLIPRFDINKLIDWLIDWLKTYLTKNVFPFL